MAFFTNIAGFRTDISDASSRMDPFAATADPLLLGRQIFETNCLICHQSSGLGIPSQYPPLAESEWVLGRGWHTDKHLIAILLYGLQGPVIVRGLVYNGNMPAWNQLSDTEIAGVLSYIRSDWGNRASPLTSEEVSSIRKNLPLRVEPWTWSELQKVSLPK